MVVGRHAERTRNWGWEERAPQERSRFRSFQFLLVLGSLSLGFFRNVIWRHDDELENEPLHQLVVLSEGTAPIINGGLVELLRPMFLLLGR